MSRLFILNSNRAKLYAAGVPNRSTSKVVPTPTRALLNRQFNACGSPRTSLQVSKVGVNCRNGIRASDLNMSAGVLNELSIAQRKGTSTQMLAKQAITMMTAFDPFLELVQSKFSIFYFTTEAQRTRRQTTRSES